MVKSLMGCDCMLVGNLYLEIDSLEGFFLIDYSG
jgi:hypothetical protein